MKKSLVFAFFAASAVLYAAEIPDLRTYQEKAPTLCFDENFNSDTSRWLKPKDGKGFQILPHIGLVGSPAATVTMPKGTKENYPSWKVPVTIQPGKAHKISFSYKISELQLKEDIRQRPRWIAATLKMHGPKGEKGKDFNFWVPAKASSEFLRCEEIVKVPENVSPEAEFMIHMDWWHTGKFTIDEITISTLDIPVELQLQIPRRLILDDAGIIAIRPQQLGKAIPETWEIAIEAAGKTMLAKREDSGLYSALFGEFPEGPVKVTAILFDRKEKQILARHAYTLQRIKNLHPVTELDEAGRLIVEGKPFFPLGCYLMMEMQDEDFKRLADGGFNIVQLQPMHGRGEKRRGPGMNTSARTLAQLEYLHKFGLKSIMFLQLMIPEKEFLRRRLEKQYNDAVDAPAIVREIGKTLAGNPDVIGYYLSDENSSNELASTQKLRETVTAADPTHITTTLTCSSEFLDQYCQTGDILLFDAYPYNPFRTPGTRGDLLEVDSQLAKIAALKTPFWFTTQAFDYARHPERHIYGKTNEEKRRHRPPSEEELTALPLLACIHGAKGIFYYAYQEVFKHGEAVDPGFGKIFWPRVEVSVKLLKQLSPWLLSTEKAPEIKLSQQKGAVRGRIFSHEGKYVILLVGLQDAPNAAAFPLPAGKEFSSLTGKTVLEKGEAAFFLPAVGYDVLTEKNMKAISP